MILETYVLHITKECNCDCKYCYEKDKTSTYTWDDIKNYLDTLFQYNKNNFTIEFLGGEPLLAFEHIKKVINYIENERHDVECQGYTITTNGTILPDELIEYMKIYPKLNWAASMDGTKYMNCLRVFKNSGINTHDTVLENFKKLNKHVDNPQLSFHMVTHPYNIGYLSTGIDYLYNQGVRHIGIGTIESTIVIGREYCDRYIYELDKVSKKICRGKYPGLCVNELESMKPREDKRFYIRDDSGKIIGESYGRINDAITQHSDEINYDTQAPGSPLGELITDIREIVYSNHQKRKNEVGVEDARA